MEDNLAYEKAQLEKGCVYIAGVDEVGRGPLAGPVTVCAIVMPLNEEDIIAEVTDSKKLSAKKREKLCYIDKVNILNATKEAMRLALAGLKIRPDVALIDAVNIESVCPVVPIIKGDLLSYSIACASIVAKVTRDKYMDDQALIYPQYGFEKNKGYGTKTHIDAIREYGITPLHRRTFVTHFI